MDDQKENCVSGSVIQQQISSDRMRHLFESINSHLPLAIDEPDFDKLWRERKERNKRVIASAATGISKDNYNEQPASFVASTVEDEAAVCIQKYIRSFLARKFYVSLLQQQFEKEENERLRKRNEQVEEGELLMQNFLLQRELQDDLVIVKNNDLRYVYAASLIQHAWRKYWSRKIKASMS